MVEHWIEFILLVRICIVEKDMIYYMYDIIQGCRALYNKSG
jgi:hypothetical protein